MVSDSLYSAATSAPGLQSRHPASASLHLTGARTGEGPFATPTINGCASLGSGPCANPEFREDLLRAREIRADFTFGEEILDIADNTADDWSFNNKTGKLTVNKELVLRSKLRIEARQFHMSRLDRETWGERQQIEVKNDWALLSPEERRRKADEMIAIIRELKEPPPQPPPLIYRWQEAPDDEPATTGGIGRQRRSATGPEGQRHLLAT